MKIIGSRWWKFDFHNHTPASDDYGKGPIQEELRRISPKDWLLNYMRAGIDCVAITDHNSGEWIDRLKTALTELTAENHADYRPLYLFPGIELTVQGNIHILALFSDKKTTSDINSLIGAVKYRTTKGASDGCSESSAIEVIDEIVLFEGIAIPAHVDQSSGLFKVYSGNTLGQILDSKNLYAIEIVDSSFAKPELYFSKKLNYAEVLGTDSHHPSGTTGSRYPGSHFTWIKMSQPSIDGLRLALIDAPLSCKRSDIFSGNANDYSTLIIECIEVEEAKFLGRRQKFICQFNPWLNSIIGGRGTGKSTVLEFLRLALKRKTEIPRNLESEFKKYSQISNDRNDEGLLRNSTIITVDFLKDGGRFRIKWISNDDSYSIEEETTDKEWRITEGDIALRFPIRIYSQKQIFELAKNPQALLQIVDDASDVNYRDWKLEWDELQSKYLSIRAQAREVQAGLQEESTVKGQLDDIKRKLEVFEKAGHANILKEYQLRQNQEKAIESWELLWEDSAEKIRTFALELTLPDIEINEFSIEKAEEKELIESIAKVKLTFQNLLNEMRQISDKIDTAYVNWKDGRPSLLIFEKITEAQNQYSELQRQLTDVGEGDPSAYGLLVKQRQDLEEKLKIFVKKRESLTQLQKSAEDCLIEIKQHRSKITSLRENFLKNTLKGNSYVQINVVPMGNKSIIEDEFRNLIARSTGFEKDIGTVDGEDGILSTFSKGQLAIEERVAKIKEDIFAVHTSDGDFLSSVKDKRFASHIQGLDPERIDRINCWFPEDSLEVRYRLKSGEKFKPVEQGSPGQKTAALLAFILSYGDEPLLLDQPEDDLDNQLIYDLIVTQIRGIKQKRQIIIATHNANIVVNGDSENIIALDVQSGQTRIVAQGGLQEPLIRNEICTVMEGGREAFEQRYRRIVSSIR